VLAILLPAVLQPWLMAASEAHLELPDPLIRGATCEAAVVVTDTPQEVQDIDLPTVAGVVWQVTGRATNVSIVNGAISRSFTAHLSMRVSAATPVTFPPITVTLADGSTLTTAAVSASAQAANAALTGEAFAQAEFDPPIIVPGQPTALVYRIYLKQDRERAIKQPDIGPPAGTISLGEKKETNGSTTDANGGRWSVATYRWPLTVSQSGAIEVSGQQEFFRCHRDFFNRLVPTSSHHIAVKPATLTVESLPTAGRPADFAGLFGPLEVAALLERARIVSGEGTVLDLRVRGRQVELLSRPTLTLPQGLQAYAKDDPAGGANDKASGERHFRWDLVPSQPGSYTIPPFSLPYYDLTTHRYQRASSMSPVLTVLPGHTREIAVTGASQPAAAIPAAAQPSPPSLPGPLRGQVSFHPQAFTSWLCGGAALLLGLAIGALQRLALRPQRAAHRGQLLCRAVAARDPEAMLRVIEALMPALAEPAQRAAAQRLLQAAELARYGGQPLASGLEADAQLLGGRR